MRFVVLDDIAYEAGRDEQGIVVRTATAGELVELTAKDAAALLARGAVREASTDDAFRALPR